MTVSLKDELAADQGKPTQCTLCRWLRGQSAAERAEWAEVLADRERYSHASIFRALARREAGVARSGVEKHRTNGHT